MINEKLLCGRDFVIIKDFHFFVSFWMVWELKIFKLQKIFGIYNKIYNIIPFI